MKNNLRNNEIKIIPLGIKAEYVSNIFMQLKGLMFSGKKNLLFDFKKERTAGIHMLFVFFPLIVVWIDSENKIKKIRIMKPFASFAKGKARYILEIPYDAKIWNKLKRIRKLKFSV